MNRAHSPLRYPGGKSCLFPMVSAFLNENGLKRGHYAEPYAGGSSLALALLMAGQVSDIHLNDVDRGIWCFWKSVLDDTDAFVSLVRSAVLTVEEWRRQREIYKAADDADILALGFATFFLNRTNRSGIIGSGGVIGGIAQEGNYKMDCRFNRDELIRRIDRIRKYRSRIHLYDQDAIQFLTTAAATLPRKTFFAIDPPYFVKGSSLYTSFYSPSDHAAVAAAILNLDRPWILTYDSASEIKELYRDRRQYLFDIDYTLQTKRKGSELLIASKGLRVPEQIRDQQVHRPQYRQAA
jgi:DNA adenine methylase